MKRDQGRIFWDSEADRWFLRNKEALRSKDMNGDIPMRLMRRYGLRPRRVIEIGAANGYRLDAIRRWCGAACFAVEASRLAVRDGRKRYPGVQFHRSLAHKLPAAVLRLRFDLIIVNFVFHWIDRKDLLSSAAQMDSLLGDGGHLIIGDHLPRRPHLAEKVKYHHLPGKDVWTYKQDYSRLFVESRLYERRGAVYGKDPGLKASPPTPIAVFLLRKSPVYVEA